MYLLFPGRHQLLTQFQFQYLKETIDARPAGSAVELVVAITSANHSNTRRNPLPFYLREMAVQDFARALEVPVYIYGIDDVGNLPNFASYTLKRIRHESDGQLDLQPGNTTVVCSTPVLEMYEALGFPVRTAELADRNGWRHHTLMPWDVVEKIAADKQWEQNEEVRWHMHPTSLALWKQYNLGAKVNLLFQDKMIGDDGDITTTRDYNTYVRQMDNIAELKFHDTLPYVRPGRIGDIGCAVGSWIRLACQHERLRESDFYGIEVARQLFDICQQRKHNGEFKNPFVFFSQRNAVTGLAFEPASMNTIHTSSLTHEIESYGSRQDLIQFIRNRFEELTHGGVWINRDVVGPANSDRMVYMQLATDDGHAREPLKACATREALAAHLNALSTFGRFVRFAHDFRRKEGYRVEYEITQVGGGQYIQLSLADACEFMSRKDYTDNWESEMHETFAFWDIDTWKSQLEAVGFTVAPQSKAFVNDWIVDNRLAGKVSLFTKAEGGMQPEPYPVMNMILVAEKQ